MKIINDTTGEIHYLVTPSGSPLSDSQIVASGTVSANSTKTLTFAKDPGKGPWVYIGGYPPASNQNYVPTRVTNQNSDVKLKISVDNPSGD